MNQDSITYGRRSGIAIGTVEHFQWLYGIAKWILLFNLLDGIFTLVWVEYFDASELNVIMRDLVHQTPVLFMLAKLSLVSLGTLFLWRNRNNSLAVISLFLAFFSYYIVLLYHIQYSATVLF